MLDALAQQKNRVPVRGFPAYFEVAGALAAKGGLWGGGGGEGASTGAGAGAEKGLSPTAPGEDGPATGAAGGTGASDKVLRKATTSPISLGVSAGPSEANRLKGARSLTMLER